MTKLNREKAVRIMSLMDQLKAELVGTFISVEDSTTAAEDNQLRKEVIEKAKAFVGRKSCEDIENAYWVTGDNGQAYCCKVEFVVSERTIIALMRGMQTNKVRIRGTARCNPSDLFNEHIGKAIALGRALGLDVSEFEQYTRY